MVGLRRAKGDSLELRIPRVSLNSAMALSEESAWSTEGRDSLTSR